MDLSTKKSVKTLGFIGIALVIIAGIVLVVQPFFAQNSKYADEIVQAESEQSIIVTKLEQLRMQKDNIKKVEKLDEDLSKKFPGVSDTPGLINMISETANKSGMTKSDITNLTAGIPTLVTTSGGTDGAPAESGESAEAPDKDAAAPAPSEGDIGTDLAEIPLDLTLKGDVNELTKFAENLRDANRNIVVLNFNLSTEEDKATATIQAKTYIYKTVAKVPADGEKAPEPEEESDKTGEVEPDNSEQEAPNPEDSK